MSAQAIKSASPQPVQLALGANVGNRRENLQVALSRLGEAGDVLAVSDLYETAPSGVTDQPPFLNAACTLHSALALEALLAVLKRLEWELGRRPARVWGPRPLDLDILLAGAETCSTPLLTVPHPRLAERGFVLFPLAEIAGDALHPVLLRTIAALRDALKVEEAGSVQRIAGPEWADGSVFVRGQG